MDQQLKNGIIIYIICFIGTIILSIPKYDVLNTIIFDIPWLSKITNENGFCFWPITHFIMYICLGLFAPKYWYIWIIIGICWEIIETFLGNTFNKNCKEINKNRKIQYSGKWMNGTVSDIFFNILGIIIGIILQKII
jgi:hypothetical protein